MNTSQLLLVSALAFGLQFNHARAATILWTGGGDGVSWNQPANWAGGVPPTASDDAVISGVGQGVTILVGAT